MSACPVCRAEEAATVVERARLPVFQNVVYATAEEARAAPAAPFRLSTCRRCGFSWNSAFDEGLVVYDERYDNEVISGVFQAYYRDLAQMLIARFDLTSGVVVEVGCGSGGFLKVLCGIAPGMRGIGVDPSTDNEEVGNVRMVRGLFGPDYMTSEVRLVVLRHVLEHIADPVGFAAMIARELPPGVPLFVEVPDLGWIYRHRAFWDFCYEHCNYFTAASLKATLQSAGLKVTAQAYGFGEQYQWAICEQGGDGCPFVGGAAAVAESEVYARAEAAAVAGMKALAAKHRGLALWGMATKGVVLSNILPDGLLTGGVDMNPSKQGRFAPGSGLPICEPAWLHDAEAGEAVLIMNSNYAAEIRSQMAAMGLKLAVYEA